MSDPKLPTYSSIDREAKILQALARAAPSGLGVNQLHSRVVSYMAKATFGRTLISLEEKKLIKWKRSGRLGKKDTVQLTVPSKRFINYWARIDTLERFCRDYLSISQQEVMGWKEKGQLPNEVEEKVAKLTTGTVKWMNPPRVVLAPLFFEDWVMSFYDMATDLVGSFTQTETIPLSSEYPEIIDEIYSPLGKLISNVYTSALNFLRGVGMRPPGKLRGIFDELKPFTTFGSISYADRLNSMKHVDEQEKTRVISLLNKLIESLEEKD